MTTPDRPAHDDLFTALSAIDITGPDADDLLWVSFKSDDTSIGGLSIQAQSTIGRAVILGKISQYSYSLNQAHLMSNSLSPGTRRVSASA
jgi:hypothetical protein